MRVVGTLGPQVLGLGPIIGYTVYQDGVPLVPTTSLTTYDVTGLNPSTTYSFQVQGFDAQGNSTLISPSVQITTFSNAPPVWQSVPAQTPIVGNAFLLLLASFCTDADLNPITFSVVGGSLPTGIVLSTNRLQGTPTVAGQVVTATIRGSDPFSHTDTTISFHTYVADGSAPPTPTGVSASGTSSSQINLTWNPSVDVAGVANEFVTGTQDYRIYRDGTLRTTVTGTSYSDTGLAASTAYSYRVSARDVALNESAQSTASVGTTQSTGVPVWTTVPTISFTQGTAANISIAGYVTDPNGLALTITKNAQALPTGVTYNQSLQRYEYNGSGPVASTSGHILTADNANTQGDWSLRSTAAGVVKATPLMSSAELATYAFAGTETVPPSLDTTLAPFGQPASTKFTVSNSDGTQSGTLKIPFGVTFGNGQTVWISFRERMPPEFAYMVAPTDGSVQGFKQAIISGINNTNQNFEVVWESNLQHGIVLGYNNSANGFNNWQQGYSPAGGLPFDYRFQPSIANDVPATASPDSVYASVNGGTDPDTGNPFSATQTEWSRIGGSYNSQSDSAFAFGLGHPLGGGVRYPVNQWATFTYCIDVGTLGTASSRVRAWVALEGQAYIKLTDASNVRLDPDVDAGFNCVYPMPYYTARTSGGRSVSNRTNNITGLAIRVVGLATALGAGTLSWNATTKRATWAEAGGSTGIARGAALWKRFANLITGSGSGGYATGKYLGIEITDFAALPGTNQTDTVTIASGRANTQTNKAEVIISSQPINATAYNAAGVRVGPVGGYAPT